MLHSNLGITKSGHLTFAGVDCVALADEYSTPLYLLDEERVREKCRAYVNAMKTCFKNGGVMYASKALNFKELLKIILSEGLLLDVVSGGELATAVAAGFPTEKIFFHGNNKTDAEILFATEVGVGHFVTDCREELDVINEIAKKHGKVQNVIMRLTPGIDTHTYEAVRTGQVDSKFGTPIETGQALEAVRYALSLSNIAVEGFHCHVGSQVFDGQTFCDSSDIMLRFFAQCREELSFIPQVLDLGGGYGVRYVESDPVLDIQGSIAATAKHIEGVCRDLNLDVPYILIEPGRSIVADAGLTLYTVGSVKEIPGYKNYVSVDGGMTDNPRFALYGSQHTVALANKAADNCEFNCSVVGKCCESGDIIAENVSIPKPVRGDILAVEVTGAYNYSMASNYNRIPRPPVVILKSGKARVGVRRETYDDIIQNDL